MDKATPTPSPASVDSVMAKAMMLVGALGDSCEAATSLPFLEAVTALREEADRLAAQSSPTEPKAPEKQRELIAKLRYMGKQYAAGQVARGGAPQKHYLEEAADEIEMMAWALSVNKVTPESAQENAALRNVIQAACIDGLPGLARAWGKYFPDHPITIKAAEVERLAAQAAPSEQADLRQLMGMNEAEIDTELIAAGISPDDAVKRADRAIKGALATIRAERRASSGAATAQAVRMLTPEEPEKCYSLDEETFYDLGDLIDMLDEEQAKPGILVYEGESVRHKASHYARGAVANLFERMGEQAFDDAGEHIGDWPDHAVKDDNSAEFEKLIYDWLDANVKVHFYTVKNVRQIALTADMLDDDDAGRTIPASGEIGGAA